MWETGRVWLTSDGLSGFDPAKEAGQPVYVGSSNYTQGHVFGPKCVIVKETSFLHRKLGQTVRGTDITSPTVGR